MNKKTAISIIIGLFTSTVGIYFALYNVPIADLYQYLKSIDYFWILPAAGVVFLTFVVRVFRWQVILSSSRKIGYRDAFHPLMIGFMVNCILPGRVGEIARPAILKKKTGTPFFIGAATVVAERMFDLLILIGFFALIIAKADIHFGVDITFGEYHLNKDMLKSIGGGMAVLSFFLVVAIVLINIRFIQVFLKKLILAFPSYLFFLGPSVKIFFTQKICPVLISLLENITIGFSMIKYPKKNVICLGLTIIIWCLQAYSYYLIARGCPNISLSYIDLFIVMIIICIFIAIPSVPGFWGIWEAGGVFALALFGVSSKDAAGFTLVSHAAQILPVLIIGLISAASVSVNIKQFSYGANAIVTEDPVMGQD